MTPSLARTAVAATDRPEAEARLAGVLSGLLGPGFRSAVAAIRAVDSELFPEERAHIAGAVARRRAEFGTARLCARQALAELGFAAGPLVPNGDRSPSWPDGAVGSISHSSGLCAVAVARAEHVAAVGLDIEDNRPLAPDLSTMVCTPAERAWLERRPQGERGRLATLFFSAKEAFYKCQYGLTGRLLDFQDVELELHPASGEFRLLAGCAGADPRLEGVRGRVLATPDAVVAVAVRAAGNGS